MFSNRIRHGNTLKILFYAVLLFSAASLLFNFTANSIIGIILPRLSAEDIGITSHHSADGTMADDTTNSEKDYAGLKDTVERLSNNTRYLLSVASVTVFLLTALVIILGVSFMRRRRTEIQLEMANLVVENSPVVLFRWKASEGWPVQYVSANIIQFGYTVDELTSGRTPFSSIIYPDDLHRIAEEVALHSSGDKESFSQTYRIYTKDGTVRWVEDHTTIEHDKDGRISHYQGVIMDITQRKTAEEALRESEKRLFEIIDFLPDATFAVGRDKRIITWNRALEEMTGARSEEMIDKGDFEYAVPFYGKRRPILIDLAFETNSEIEAKYNYIKREGDCLTAEVTLQLLGKTRIIWGKVARLYDSHGDVAGAIETLRDITEQKKIEEEQIKLREQLFQSQKMETVGLLAGGIAHDFNNMLTPIIGYTEMMLLDMPEEDPNHRRAEQIYRAAELVKHLTGRLLAFSRKQVLDLKVLNIGNIIKGFEQMVHRTIRENIEITLNIDPSVGNINADRGQIEQVLLNLAVNSQDAMPEGGILNIEAANMELDESYTVSHPEVMPGMYVMISVSDTGTGMDEETMEHIFEPFFTTKDREKGTGLGLATVYGIVKQHGGSLSVYSEKGKGSTFRVFLPMVSKEGIETEKKGVAKENIEKGSETILIVEDNETVRMFALNMLQELGYNVIIASSADMAIKISRDSEKKIDLLLTDVIMPKMNGRELYDILKKERSGLKVLFISGYAGSIIGHHGILDRDVNFLQKPFTIYSLSKKVRSVLES